MVISIHRDIDIDIDAPDRKGNTPLLTAAFSGSIEAFQFLMVSGANVGATGRDGKTAAVLAAERNSAQVLEVRCVYNPFGMDISKGGEELVYRESVLITSLRTPPMTPKVY